MATRVLTPVAQRRSRDDVSARNDSGHGRDWRRVLLSQDAEAIWHQLSILVRSAAPEPTGGYEQLTQDLFLHLLTTERISSYLEKEYSDSEISADLISIVCG